MRRKHSFLEKLLLTAALAIGAGGCGTITPNGIPSSITGSAVRSRVFPNAIAFWIPEGLDVETVRDQVNSGIRDVLKNYVVGDTLEPILNFFGADLDNSGGPRSRFFVKTDDMTNWVQNLTVCSGQKIRVALVYETGSNQNSSPPHLGGLNYSIYSTPLGQAALPSTEIADYNLLPSGEEAANPPNFLIEKNLRDTAWMLMHEGSSLPDPLPSYVDRIYTIGRPYNAEDNAVVVVDVGCDGNINTEPEPSPEPTPSPEPSPEPTPEPNPENCGPSHLGDCTSLGACERAGGNWENRYCYGTSEPTDPPDNETCSDIGEGVYSGRGLYSNVNGEVSYDTYASIRFNDQGSPMSTTSHEIRPGLTLQNGDLELTISRVSCLGNCVEIESDVTSSSGATGTCVDAYCAHDRDVITIDSSCLLSNGNAYEERMVSGEISR